MNIDNIEDDVPVSDFRLAFTSKFFKDLEHQVTFVKPMELGILKARYTELYNKTPPEQKDRIFEQLRLAVLIWSTLKEDVTDDIQFIQKTMQVQESLHLVCSD
tara:strand:- start:65 stop:373 length:309 start_codon:yes stop_codon:yes gene_type:complete